MSVEQSSESKSWIWVQFLFWLYASTLNTGQVSMKGGWTFHFGEIIKKVYFLEGNVKRKQKVQMGLFTSDHENSSQRPYHIIPIYAMM